MRLIAPAAVATFAALAPAAGQGNPLRVAFDVSYTVECRDVTPDEFAENNPNSKIVEAVFQISALLREGEESDVEELMYVVWSPEKRMRVADFEPKTQVTSPVADKIEVLDAAEDATLLDAAIKAQINPPGGLQFMPTAGASKTKKQNLQQKYSRLPPKQLLIASGTTNREYGVFFKLKPSSQESLEGQREFVCLFVVPRPWSGDYVYVECRATARSESARNALPRSGAKRVLVGLHLQGDQEAKAAARRVAAAYEVYSQAQRSGPTTRTTFKPVGDVTRLLRRVPGSSLVGAVFDGGTPEQDDRVRRQAEAEEAFRAALDHVIRFAGRPIAGPT